MGQMLAVIQKGKSGYVARFERQMNHPVEKVWAMLTENEKLALWFSELRVENLCEGGTMAFDMRDGTFGKFPITDFQDQSVLAYTWGEDHVRFELHDAANGCRLVLAETIQKINDHTAKDLAGWHVCLNVIEALLDGRTVVSRQDDWKNWYKKYVAAVKEAAR
ncbi:SRPBCC family protein [Domibacillus tundrae]|uniref:SRPBCC family protein n=1 Tax=Domibacillus tundrae TaxID=1587527 RepID=UPI003CCC0911